MRFPTRSKNITIAITSLLAIISCLICLAILAPDLLGTKLVEHSAKSDEFSEEEAHRKFELQLWRDQFIESKSLVQLSSVISAAESEGSWASATAMDEVASNNRFALPVRLLATESLARIALHKDYPGLQVAAKSRHRQLRLSASDALVRCGHNKLGFDALLREAYSKSSRQAALFRLRRLTGQNFHIDAKAGPAATHKQIQVWKQWIDEQGNSFEPRDFSPATNPSNS